MTYMDSIRFVFTKHINRENQSIGKTNFKHQPGKNSPTKSTISNSVQKNQQKTFSEAMGNHKSAGGAFSHHIFLQKMSEEKKNNIPKPIANISLKSKNKQTKHQ